MKAVKTIDPQSLSIPERHGYLLAAVAPRPIAFASTVDKAGNVNLSPFSFFNVFSSNPPVMIFSPARSGKDQTQKDTYLNIKEVPEAVISIVNYPMVEQVSLASTAYDKGVNEFLKAGFTELASLKVKPPRVAESPVSFECVVDQVIELGEEGAAGNLIICRVVMIHIREEYLDERGKLDTTKLDLIGRMGDNWYCKASGEALFEIPKPLGTKGIGVDQLPRQVRNSPILTANNLGRLGNVKALPDTLTLTQVMEEAEVKAIISQYSGQSSRREEALHRLAQKYLEAGKTEKALAILMAK